jgi:hypothetical protein
MHNRLVGLIAFAFVLAACETQERKSWAHYIDNTGTYSSPRTADLNKDGIPDIVLGAGGQEEVFNDTCVIALDGRSGNVLWAIPGINQFVGSAIFQDITRDSVPDVFIGGRWAQFVAIDGASGEIIWSFFPERTRPDGSDGGWYNFTTPQWIPDQDKDGFRELLVANGGDARAAPGDTNRPAGRLLVISSATGKILGNSVVPDGKETYMSVVCEARGDSLAVYFGTGGETIGGGLYRTTVEAIINGNISGARLLAQSGSKGFVASPVLIDINKDGWRDIVINTAEGKMLALDGKNNSTLWQVEWPGTEAYTMPAPGLFNNDSIPDFFCNFAIGVFPKLNRSIRFMVDGSSGKILFADTIPAFQYASAVVADINGDGFDEALMNQAGLKRKQFENYYYSNLLAFDFKNNRRIPLGDTIAATNLASTPWIGDMDNDGRIDILYTAVKYENAQFDLQKPLGLYVHRFASNIPFKRSVRWGTFMGSNYTGTY